MKMMEEGGRVGGVNDDDYTWGILPLFMTMNSIGA